MPSYFRITGEMSEAEQELFNDQQEYSYPHSSPNSVFIGAIGNMWKPGAWQCVVDMIAHTRMSGFNCMMDEIGNTTMIPWVGLSDMRNEAVARACRSGCEYALLIENDALPEPDMLIKLMSEEMPIVAPIIFDKEINGAKVGIGLPQRIADNGIQPMRWVPLTAVLFKVNVFNATGPMPFASTTLESQLFQLLWHYGHRAWMQTDVELKVASQPQRMFTKDWKSLWEWLERTYDRMRNDEPDRSYKSE